MRYFVRTVGAHFRSGRTLYILTVLGVALGVASVLTIQIINQSALAAFGASVEAVSGDTDFSVRGRLPTIPESLYVTVLAEPGVATARPIFRTDVALADTSRIYLDVIGVDFFASPRVAWAGPPADAAVSLAQSGWVAVTQKLADDMGWAAGDSVRVIGAGRVVTLVIGGLLDFERIAPLASRRLAVMDIAQAQDLFGTRGEIHQIDVSLRAEEGSSAVQARLQARLGPGVEVITPGEQRREAARLLEAFRLNLTALSFISLLVGFFLVYTSVQAALVRRRAEFGLLRSMGATRRQVLGLILGEAGLLGALGVCLGLPLGYWAAQANVAVVSGTLTSLYLLEEIESLHVPGRLFMLAAVIGIGGATLGALIPALDMSRRDTRTLLAAFTLHERFGTLAAPLFVAGLVELAATAYWYWRFGQSWRPAGFVLATMLVAAIPLLTPFVVARLARVLTVRGFGFVYALKTLGVRLGTSAFAISSLAIAVSMLIAITFMIGSFRSTLDVWIRSTVQADVYISPSGRGPGRRAGIDSALIGALAADSRVRAIDRIRTLPVYAGSRRIGLAGIDVGIADGAGRIQLLEGNPSEAFSRVRKNGAILISEPLSRKAALRAGDVLELYGPAGILSFPIAGVYYDYATERGAAILDIATFEARFGPGPVSGVALYLDSATQTEAVIDDVKSRFARAPLAIRSNRSIRVQALRIFDQTFAITRILQGMTLVIAASGITLTLLVFVRERISELALYRALGASRAQISRILVYKGLAMGGFGLVIGLGMGLVLATVLILVINRAYFGWTIQFSWPVLAVAQQCIVILLAAAVASLYPAFRAARTPAAELARDDL